MEGGGRIILMVLAIIAIYLAVTGRWKQVKPAFAQIFGTGTPAFGPGGAGTFGGGSMGGGATGTWNIFGGGSMGRGTTGGF